NIRRSQRCLFRTHVGWCADELFEGGEDGLARQGLARGSFGYAEINDFGSWCSILLHCDHNVRRLDVTVDDAFLMGMLDSLANLNEEFQAFFGREGVFWMITVISDLQAADQFHDKERATGFRCAGIQDLGDIPMLH